MTKFTGENLKVNIIGAGRLATQLTKALHSKGIKIACVYSRTIESAKTLADKINVPYTNNIDILNSTKADIYIYAVKDDAIETIANQTPNLGMHFHTSGSVEISVFNGKKDNYGSIYPLQTFNIDRDVNFNDIPIFYEANNDNSTTMAKNLCNVISQKVYSLDSDKRKYLHLSAVFACNFANALWATAENILDNNDIPKDVIYPLINETLSKAIAIGASNSQTGPAIRRDEKVMNKHIDMLNDDLLKRIYADISQKIIQTNK